MNASAMPRQIGTCSLFMDGKRAAKIALMEGDILTRQEVDENGILTGSPTPFSWNLWANVMAAGGHTYSWSIRNPAWIEVETRQELRLYDVYVRWSYPEGDHGFTHILTFEKQEDADLAVHLLELYNLYGLPFGMSIYRFDYERGYHPETKSKYAPNFEVNGEPKSGKLTDDEFSELVITECKARLNLTLRFEATYVVPMEPLTPSFVLGKRHLAPPKKESQFALFQNLWLEFLKLFKR